jgi:hypothetical protein
MNMPAHLMLGSVVFNSEGKEAPCSSPFAPLLGQLALPGCSSMGETSEKGALILMVSLDGKESAPLKRRDPSSL